MDKVWIVATQFGRTLTEAEVVKTTDRTVTIAQPHLVWGSDVWQSALAAGRYDLSSRYQETFTTLAGAIEHLMRETTHDIQVAEKKIQKAKVQQQEIKSLTEATNAN